MVVVVVVVVVSLLTMESTSALVVQGVFCKAFLVLKVPTVSPFIEQLLIISFQASWVYLHTFMQIMNR